MTWMKPSAPPPLLLLLVVSVVCCLPLHASARMHIVLDVEGVVEDYASLTTIAQSLSLRTQLRLVTVSGLTWGHAMTVARSVCRFLSMAHLEGVTVSIGAQQATEDAYDSALSRGGCARSQGFPATPRDAARRGMKYSRVDVTNSFGAARVLPAKSCNVLANATEALQSLINNMSAGDTVTYFALSGSSNLAAALKCMGRHLAKQQQQQQLLQQVMTVHLLEKGYNLAVDAAATKLVMEEAYEGRLRCVTYLPLFYDPAFRFSLSKWNHFSGLANAAGVSKSVAWLYTAWKAKKELIELRDGGSSRAFFEESVLASSLVTLCALDGIMQQACNRYHTAVSHASLQFDDVDQHADGAVSYRISGGNVTSPSFLSVQVWNNNNNNDSKSNATQFILAESADTPPLSGANQADLSSTFWSAWLEILQRP